MIAICTPSYGELENGYSADLLAMTAAGGGVDFTYLQISGSILPNVRTFLAQRALRHPEVTHLLWIDADMRFPPDTATRLLAHGLPIVGANYRQRGIALNTASSAGIKIASKTRNSHFRTGLQEVDTIGLGVVLVERKVFETMEMPWFLFPYDAMTQLCAGEDVYFFGKARQAGFKVMVDHDLSADVRHIGKVELEVV